MPPEKRGEQDAAFRLADQGFGAAPAGRDDEIGPPRVLGLVQFAGAEQVDEESFGDYGEC